MENDSPDRTEVSEHTEPQILIDALLERELPDLAFYIDQVIEERKEDRRQRRSLTLYIFISVMVVAVVRITAPFFLIDVERVDRVVEATGPIFSVLANLFSIVVGYYFGSRDTSDLG